jgi:hypothetical protein
MDRELPVSTGCTRPLNAASVGYSHSLGFSLVCTAVIFTALLLLYSPSLRGEFLWDDNDNTTKPELQSAQGLQRIWLELGATQTYYPVLHSLYWIEHKLWGDWWTNLAVRLKGIAA